MCQGFRSQHRTVQDPYPHEAYIWRKNCKMNTCISKKNIYIYTHIYMCVSDDWKVWWKKLKSGRVWEGVQSLSQEGRKWTVNLRGQHSLQEAGCPSQNLILLPVLSEHEKVFNKVTLETMKTQMLMFKTLSSPESCGLGNSTPHQYSCLENSMARGAWWATVNGVAKNRIGLSMHAPES